jgi:hypothetical protein
MLKLKDYLNENKNTYSYGCCMVGFQFPNLIDIIKKIKLEDVYFEGDAYGVEFESHVTLLYGLHSDEIQDNLIMDIMSKYSLKTIILNEISIFQNEKYDVLKFKANNRHLQKINQELCELPHTTSFPDYNAHCTIAYLKPGCGEQYVQKFKGMEYIVFPNYIIYSKPDNNKIYRSINL